jgi:quinolinate synthase
MGMNTLENLEATLINSDNEILVDPEIGKQALLPLERMVKFAESSQLRMKGNA